MKKFALGLVVALLCSTTMAHASLVAYGIAWDNVFKGFITVNPISGTTSTVPSDKSSASAAIGGLGTQVSTTALATPVIVSLGTPTQAAGDFSQVGPMTSTYSIGEAEIVSIQTTTGTGVQALNKAESNVLAPGDADSHSFNTSASQVTFTTIVGTGDTIDFNFDAAPYLLASLTGGAGPGSSVIASIAVHLVVTNSAGATVFDWAPSGNPGPITGGTASSDPFSLNTNRTQQNADGFQEYNPTGVNPVGIFNPTNFGNFHAITNGLVAGTYNISLSMNEDTTVVAVAAIPEPGTILLFGFGLIGLAVVSRRKRS